MRVNEEHEVYCPECDTIHVIPPLPAPEATGVQLLESVYARVQEPPESESREQAVVEALAAAANLSDWLHMDRGGGVQTSCGEEFAGKSGALTETCSPETPCGNCARLNRLRAALPLAADALARSTPAPSGGGS